MELATRAPMDVLLRPAALARAWMGPGRDPETIAVPGVVLGPGDVLVRIDLVTITEDDLAITDGDEQCPVPTVLGREFVGRIAALGGTVAAVDGIPLELGERVVSAVGPHERIGAHRELVGGFATHVHLVEGTPIARVGEALPACILAPVPGVGARAAAIMRRLEEAADPEDLVVTVAGTGADPLVLAAMIAASGGRPRVASADPRVRARAERFGAALAPEHILETDLSARFMAASPDPRELVVRGGAPTPADLVAAVAFMRAPGTRRYPFADLVSAPLPFARLDEAIDLARAGRHLRVAIAPGA
ncbi:putative threonine dehydrogenase [Microbacterium sp. TS-1]|uniref:alcohol dehydrogenase catalytic domain-containing protein n=1 Tax=Microbacterium sp. TS-1 TaxID=1344956 RepID=UPI00038FEC39|nr:alcohol dehydrogenase catalytic domain-containing protein [Microbacterium sp. TS-1]GAD32790.1 putative threonine dehydrogenase [Microbacterium sp. TS-1]